MHVKTIKVRIEGTTALLFNRFLDASIEGKSKTKSGALKDLDPTDKLYRINGQIYTPATHILGMLINAAKNFQITGKRKSTYSKIVGSTVEVEPEAITHETQKYEIFSISGVNPSTKGRMLIKRPMLSSWAIEFSIKHTDDVPFDVLKEILDYGGKYVGIGDWRPEKKGKFGKFIVTVFNSAG